MDFGGASHAPTWDDLVIDDSLSLVERIQKYCVSTIALQRLVHVKMLATAAESLGQASALELLPLLPILMTDPEMIVRQHLALQLAPMARVIAAGGGEEVLLESILPIVSGLVDDVQDEVRDAAAEALVGVAKCLKPEDLGAQVLTIALRLAHEDDQDALRCTAAKLLNMLAPVLGKDLCHQFVAPEIIALSEDMNSFWVRKACAQNMAGLMSVAGLVDVVTRLLPAFDRLCRDANWGVRKACAEELVNVTQTLATVSAADAAAADAAAAAAAAAAASTATAAKPSALAMQRPVPPPRRTSVCSTSGAALLVAASERFGADKVRWVRVASAKSLGKFVAMLPPSHITPRLVKLFCGLADGTVDPSADPDVAIDAASAGGPAEADCEVQLACAFSLPGVVLALGASRWAEVAPAFRCLSRHSDLRIRRTLAHSLHEVARVIGPDLAEAELLGTFDLFLRDLDGVKSGVISHLSDFFFALSRSCRESFLPVLAQVTSDSDPLEWRLRELLALQLPALATCFSTPATYSVVIPLLLRLLEDEVAEVRRHVPAGIVAMINRFGDTSEAADDEEEGLGSEIEAKDDEASGSAESGDAGASPEVAAAATFSSSSSSSSSSTSPQPAAAASLSRPPHRVRAGSVSWRGKFIARLLACAEPDATGRQRQAVAHACSAVAHGIAPELVAEHFLPVMRILAADRISNVRLALARAAVDLPACFLDPAGLDAGAGAGARPSPREHVCGMCENLEQHASTRYTASLAAKLRARLEATEAATQPVLHAGAAAAVSRHRVSLLVGVRKHRCQRVYSDVQWWRFLGGRLVGEDEDDDLAVDDTKDSSSEMEIETDFF